MNIALLSQQPFPGGSASASYILNICRIMKSCGHNVTVFGCRRRRYGEYALNGEFDGIRYFNYDAENRSKLITYLYDSYYGLYAISQLSRLKKTNLVVLFGLSVRASATVRAYCKLKGMKLATVSCEWYTEDSFSPSIKRGIVRDKVNLIPYLAKNVDAAIGISTLLTGYYRDNGVNSVMIPNVVDLTDEKWQVRAEVPDDGKLKIAYAGVPGVGKDELGTVVRAIGMLPEEMRLRTELNVYGMDEKGMANYLRACGVGDCVPPYVICHGRQDQDVIPARLNECHYTVLIRKSTLRTNAGFSTKMVESFSAGIPFIANITGDIADYLKNGVNGVVVADETAEACRDALVYAWELRDSNSELRRAAYRTAEENFDYRLYKAAMKEFFGKINIK